MSPFSYPPSSMLDRLPERAAGVGPAVAMPGARSMRERAEDVVKWAAVLLGCSIPVSVAADNILFAFILLCWIAGGGYREKLAAIRRNPVAIAALALFALYLVGGLYTIGSGKDALDAVTKALRLLLIVALIPLLREPEWRERGLVAFQGSMLVTLILSYLLWLGILPPNGWVKGTELDPVAFKGHITHNLFMAFTAFLFAQNALTAKTRWGRFAFAALCAAVAANVLLMVPGRTGIIVLLVLFAYFLCRMLRARGLVLAGVALAALAVVVIASPNSMLHQRITLADDEFNEWRAGVTPVPTSSIGQRLEYLRNTLRIIGENPLLGVGTGGFGKAYADRVNGTGAVVTQNPHNEFLMITVQFGLAGLMLLTGLFVTQWRLAAHLPRQYDQAAARALVLTIGVASLLTSTLVDHAEGFFFVYMSGLLFAGYASSKTSR